MRRLLLIQSETGLLKKEYAEGATDKQCFDIDDRSVCKHWIEHKWGESCGLFDDWFDGAEDNTRFPQCLAAEKLAKDKGLTE